jgi:long-chain acyl-CoA synthetase
VVISDCADEAVANAIAQVNSQLESFQHIDDWRRWPHGDFPRTRLLKIDRRLVQRWANAAEADRATPTSGPEPADDSLIRIIRLSLGDSSATVNEPDRLADIGLDSLRRLNVVALIEEELGVTISDESVTPATTVGQLRQIVSDASPVEHEVRRPAWPYWTWVRVIGDGLREGVIRAVVRIWVRTDVVGAEELDSLDAPAIFIFNHGDDFDGPVVYQALPRRIRRRLAVATAADVMADHKVLAFVVRLCFAGFDFARAEPYMPSMEYVGQMLDRGWNVLIAPEGRISTTGELQSFKSGIGLLAVSLGVAVVPMKTVGLVGTVPLHAKWPRKRSRATVRIGRPMFFGPQMGYEDVTETLRGAMEAL